MTSNAGWDVIANAAFLKDICAASPMQASEARYLSDADPAQVRKAAEVGANRVELYTKPYADNYFTDRESAVKPFVEASQEAADAELGLNAGHDLNLSNRPTSIAAFPTLTK